MINPKVSIIVPTYNRAEYIGKAIDSVFSQTYKHLEIIVIDDGSTDGTGQVLKKYGDGDKVRYLYLDHVGVSEARNRGLQESSGEYIAFLDSDDVWLPVKIEKQLEVFRVNPEVGLVCSRAEVINENGEFVGEHKPELYAGSSLKDLITHNFIVFSSVIIKKSILSKLGYFFDKKLDGAVDYDFALRFAQITEIYFLDEVLVRYRITSDAISRDSIKIYKRRISILEKFKETEKRREQNFLIKKRLKLDIYCLSKEYLKKNKLLHFFFYYLLSKIP
jgi:glycosyltransferase involved in cell wall biosynthesis